MQLNHLALKMKNFIYIEVGCDKCANGYKGRIGIYEVLDINEQIGQLVTKRAASDEIQKLGPIME